MPLLLHTPLFESLTHATAWIACALILTLLTRYALQRSPLIGAMMCAGILLRGLGGAVLYLISLKHLPLMRNLQLEGGFWLLASDATVYYRNASYAVSHGLSTISPSGPSPAYVQVLTIALRLFGQSPLTAVAVNVLAYAAAAGLCVAMWPRADHRPQEQSLAIATIALSFSPLLLLASTQPLKDQVFVLLVVVALFAVRPLLTVGEAANPATILRRLGSLAVATATLHMIAGIRAYYAMMIVGVVALVASGWMLTLPVLRWPRQLCGTAFVIVVLWTAYVSGAGPYAGGNQDSSNAILHSSVATVQTLESRREGFVNAGGDTNLVLRHSATTAPMIVRLEDEALGLLALMVPASVLKTFPGITLSGGRGLLVISDIDTLFVDLTIAFQIALLFRNWRTARDDIPFVALVFTLATGVAFAMAYVVTNYGTLFRLRLMYAVPLWICSAGLGVKGRARNASQRVRGRADALLRA